MVKMRIRIFKNFDRNFDNIVNIVQCICLMGMIVLLIMGISAIAYSLWESLVGHWGFHVSQDTFPVVGAIVLIVVQLNNEDVD
jgi:hypothetical protein